MSNDKRYETMLILRAQLEHIVFKDFFRNYDMPKGIKQVHAITLIKLKHIKQISMTQLSYALNLEKASVTTVADKLVDLGYVYSERSKEDRRVYHLMLTDTGKEFAEQISRDHMKYFDNLFKDFDSEEKNKLFESLDLITQALESTMDFKHKK